MRRGRRRGSEPRHRSQAGGIGRGATDRSRPQRRAADLRECATVASAVASPHEGETRLPRPHLGHARQSPASSESSRALKPVSARLSESSLAGTWPRASAASPSQQATTKPAVRARKCMGSSDCRRFAQPSGARAQTDRMTGGARDRAGRRRVERRGSPRIRAWPAAPSGCRSAGSTRPPATPPPRS